MRILLAAIVAWQLMTGVLVADDAAPRSATQEQTPEDLQLGQRVAVDSDVSVSADGGDSILLRRGTVLTILALDGDRAQVCELAPVWIDQSELLSLCDAKAKLIRELKKNPDDVALLVALGDVYRGREVHDLAVETYCRALAYERDNLDAMRGRAESLHCALRSGTCLKGLRGVLQDDPNDAKAHYLRGYVMVCHDRWDDAIESLDAAVKTSPLFVQAWIRRAEAKWRSGDVDGAMADYDEAIRLCSNATDAYVSRAVYYWTSKKRGEALADLKTALEINPRSHKAHDLMARLILWACDENVDDEIGDDEIGNGQKALEHAKIASKRMGGQDSGYALTLSKAYAAVADHSRAVEWKMHALRLDMARERYYRTWQFDNAFRHGKPKQREDEERQRDENDVRRTDAAN